MSIGKEAVRRVEQLVPAPALGPLAGNDAGLASVSAVRARGPHRLPADGTPVASGAEPSCPAAVWPSVAAATLDLEALQSTGHFVPGQARSAVVEEFRDLKRLLLNSVRTDPAATRRQALVMVTSAVAGEGKTFCAINLAMSLAAEIDHSVLLVDADLHRPNLFAVLGVAPPIGLLDLLVDPSLALARVIVETSVPNLSLLSAGTPCATATELLASDAMGRLLDSLLADQPERIVVFDAPPLASTSEAQVLASRVGQVVLVVAAGITPREQVAVALSRLADCPVVIPLLNRAACSAPPRRIGDGLQSSSDPGQRGPGT